MSRMKKSVGVAIAFLFTLLFSTTGLSQACAGNNVTVSLQNFTQTPTEVEFDVYIMNSGTTTLKLAAMAAGINLNAGFIPAGATATFTNISPPSANAFPGLTAPTTAPVFTAGPFANHIRWTQSPVAFAGAISMPAGVDMKFGRFKITSSLSWTPSFPGTLDLLNATSGPLTKVNVVVYCNTNTNSTALNSTAPGTTSIGAQTNIILNPVATGSNSAVLSGDATYCTGGGPTNLSIAISGGTSPYDVVYSDGTSNTTITGYTSGTNFSVSPTATTTYSIVSVHDAGGLIGINNSGTPTVTVNPIVTPSFTSIPASICSGGALTLPTTSDNGVNGTWSPAVNNTATTSYTFTPGVGECATGPVTVSVAVDPTITTTFAPIAAICSGDPLSLPGTSTNGISGTWSPAVNNTATTTYTFTPSAGQCGTVEMMTVTVNPNVTPTFATIAGICVGGSFTLPTTSTNGVTGTWSPAVNNTTTTTYTFTPAAGQCATTTSMTVGVSSPSTPTFTPVGSICSGGTFVLPTTSNNGINGTWSPGISSFVTTTYTFTPNPGQCASTETMTVTVNSYMSPTFTQIPPICAGSSFTLPTTSNNGVTGTWSPAPNPNASTNYLFTPDAGQCASPTTMSVNTFNLVPPTLTFAANITALSATVFWNPMTLPAGSFFTIEYRPQGTTTWLSGGTAPGTATSKALTGLLQGTTYQCRVSASCSPTTASAWSAWLNFQTLFSPCNAAPVLSITDNWGSAVTLTWPLIPGAAWYEFRYKESSSSVWLNGGTIVGNINSKIFTNLTPQTSYDFEARTFCANSTGSPWSPTLTVMTNPLNGCAVPPVISDNPTLGTSTTIVWATVPGAAYYEFRYKEAPATLWLDGGTATTTQTSKLYTGLTNNTTYDFEGRSVCFNGVTSTWTPIVVTTTGGSGCELPPSITSPATTTSSSITVSWPALPGAVQYNLQYKESTSATWLAGGNSTTNSKTFIGLTPVTDYDFQVNTLCNNGVLSSWSAQATFQTDSLFYVGIEELMKNGSEASVIVYPNPSKNIVNIEYISNNNVDDTRIVIVDFNGRTVQELDLQTKTGPNKVVIDVDQLSRGFYSVLIYQNDTLWQTSKLNKN